MDWEVQKEMKTHTYTQEHSQVKVKYLLERKRWIIDRQRSILSQTKTVNPQREWKAQGTKKEWRGVSHLSATDWILSQTDARGLALLQAAAGHVRQQVLQLLIFPKDFHSRHSNGEAGARLLLALIDELEEPGNGTGHNA